MIEKPKKSKNKLANQDKNQNGQKTGKERLNQKSENNCRLDTKLLRKKGQSPKKKQAK